MLSHPSVCFYVLLDRLEPIIRRIGRNEGRMRPPSLSSKCKQQINKPERRKLFGSKCHLAVAESPEDQTVSPQASAGDDSGAPFSLFGFFFGAACLSLSIFSHANTRAAFSSRLKCQSIPTLIVWAEEECVFWSIELWTPEPSRHQRNIQTGARFSGVTPWAGSPV